MVWTRPTTVPQISGQDEPNRALWLASRAGKMELSCPLGTTRRIPQEKFPRKPYNKSFIDPACSVNNPYINITLFSATLINGIVSYERQSSTSENFSRTKLNHANFITNEKRSLIESETDICLTRARLFGLIVMNQKCNIWWWRRLILGKSLRSY